MLNTKTLVAQLPLTMDPDVTHAGMNSVFAAAVVSRSFCQRLLSDPEQALKHGYMGKGFALSAEDASLLVSINARSLPDLAQQVVHTLGKPSF